ncbi:MAG: glycoside hydrolase family 3 C-terminal domain-containing protein [Desulfobacterales bacterium]
MERKIDELIQQLTLEEKASLCGGASFWTTQAIERLDIPSIMMTDGPHGLRKQSGESDHLGLNQAVPATCFPTASALACSWDVELAGKVGGAIGEEAQAENVHIVLGPGVNIKRSPLCGRNFEYYSEDPVLAGDLAAAWVNGVQSQGVGTSVKHYAVNNQEYQRMSIDVQVDERTLREIYLAGFERVVKTALPWTVMCAYNKVNGILCAEHKELLSEILRDEWGFEGVVVSDWGAVDVRVNSLKAGLDLQMPGIGDSPVKAIMAAVNGGEMDETALDDAVRNSLRILFRAVEKHREGSTYDQKAHHALAREAAGECIVLLKNQDDILPLEKANLKKIAVIGAFAKTPRYQGGGSSHINPTQLDTAYDEILSLSGSDLAVGYADGYVIASDDVDDSLIDQARTVAESADLAVLFVGLPDRYESEGYDREHIRLPESHGRMIDAVCSVQNHVVVVLINGSPVSMEPWGEAVGAIIEGGLLGQAGGGAIADVLFGEVNPSGKLAETIPYQLSDTPSHLNFPGKKRKVQYREGVFVGYRYYDAKGMAVRYPFGFGLSYTTFDYSNLSVSKKEVVDTEGVEVNVIVKNTGAYYGKEIVQVYVRDIECREARPDKELKAFSKVGLDPGEEKTLTFHLGFRDFAYYEDQINDWYVETGDFDILVGRSSRDICLKETIAVSGTKVLKDTFDRHSTIGELMQDPEGMKAVGMIFGLLKSRSERKSEAVSDDMMQAMMRFAPLRTVMSWSKGAFNEEKLEELLKTLNQ